MAEMTEDMVRELHRQVRAEARAQAVVEARLRRARAAGEQEQSTDGE